MMQLPEGMNDPHLEIKEKVDYWHTRMRSQLERFNDYANFWRLIKPARSADFSGFANPQVTETTRATEAIATFLFRAMTSANPNFQFLSKNPMIDPEQLWVAEQVVAWQQGATNFKRKLLKGCRSLALMGTVAFEEPWTVNMPYYEATDFIPRSLLQVAFDPLSFDISLSPWHAVIEYVTEDQLRALAVKMPMIWDAEAIEKAISDSQDMKNISPEVTARMTASGYQTYSGGTNLSHIYQLTNYYGILKGDKQQTEWCISTVNDLATVRFYESPYKRRPLGFAHLNEFEMEPYSYGVGRIAESTQPEINSNRARMHDTITFSLFNQWLVNRAGNLKPSQMRIKPWGMIEVEGDPDAMIKALRPQLEGVNFGMQMEAMMKGEFRSTTGASDSLQAIVTEATATESSIAQTESVRRLSVIAEVCSDPMLREHISKMHENNQIFLDQPFSIGVTGQPSTLRVFPSDVAMDVEVATKIVTDKDFRPQRNKDLLQFLQVVTSIRSQNPQLMQVNLQPFVEEFARGIGMNPKAIWAAMPQIPGGPEQAGGPQVPSAMDRLGSVAQEAQQLRSNAGALGQAASQDASRGLAEVA